MPSDGNRIPSFDPVMNSLRWPDPFGRCDLCRGGAGWGVIDACYALSNPSMAMRLDGGGGYD